MSITQEQIDYIGEQWDGCMYDAPGGDIDIGQAIRAELAKLATPAVANAAPELPPLPEHGDLGFFRSSSAPEKGDQQKYSADQMRAHGQACAATAIRARLGCYNPGIFQQPAAAKRKTVPYGTNLKEHFDRVRKTGKRAVTSL